MAEPRKPRVIRTRTGTVPPGPAKPVPDPTPDTPAEKPAKPKRRGRQKKSTPDNTAPENTAAENTVPENTAPVPPPDQAGVSVRSTSAKVSVLPLTDGAAHGNGDAADGPAAVGDTDGDAGSGTAGDGMLGEPVAKKSSGWTIPVRKFTLPRPGSRAARTTTEPSRDGVTHDGVTQDRVAEDPDSHDGGGADAGAKVLAFPIPEHKRRRRTLLLSVAGVFAVVALIMGVTLFTPALAVKTVVFDGQKLVGEGTLQLAVAPIMSKPLPQVTDAEVQGLLADVIQVKSSRIEARPPSTLLVHIVERVPVALLKNGDEFLLVDQDGVQLGSTGNPDSVALPLIDGGTAAIGQDTFRAMTAVLANLPQSILEQLANATAKSPEAVELALADGRSVIWGDASEMELKAQVLEALLTAPPPTAAAGKPAPAPAKVFDVSAPRHPVTR